MRILIGTQNTANAITMMAQGFRALGHQVTTAAFVGNKFYPDQSFDIIVPQTRTSSASAGVKFQVSELVGTCFREHDLFVFIAASSLCGRFQELELLRRLGKKTIVFCMGSEIRHKSVAQPFWNAYGCDFPDAHYPPPPLAAINTHPACLSMYENTFANKIYNMRMAERYATALFSNIPTSLLALRPFYSAPFPFSHEACTFRIPGRKAPHIIHAPTARAFKKTDIILAALERLRAMDVPFTFELIENRPNHEVLSALTNADILIDQIGGAGGHGRLSLEGLASGCVVVGCNNACVPYPPQCPIIRGIPETLAEQLRVLCENRELRVQIAARSRAWMLQAMTAPRTIAQRMIDACEGTLPPDYYPTAFMQLCTALENEPLPAYLQTMTLEILQQYGCHPDADLTRLLAQGMVPSGSADALHAVPRWPRENIHEVAPHAWCGTHIPPHAGSNTIEYHLQQLS